jgi:hypothetical protein
MIAPLRRLVLCSLALSLGCDVALLPEAASYEGMVAPRLSLSIVADATNVDVQAVDLELVDVQIHRASDEEWVWIGGGEDRIQIETTAALVNHPVPLPVDVYDAVRVVVDEPRVAHGGSWHACELPHDEVELPVELELDGDTAIELRFDLAQSLAGSKGGKWRFDPSAHAAVAH